MQGTKAPGAGGGKNDSGKPCAAHGYRISVSTHQMSRRMQNAFAALVQDSDSDPEVQEQAHEHARVTSIPTKPTMSRKKTQWKPLDLAAVPEPRRKPRQAGPPTKRQYRRTTDGRLVLAGPAPVPAEERPFETLFPALTDAPSVTVRGAWSQGIEAVIAAKDLEDPAIEIKRQQAARAAWLAKQRVANRVAVYDDDYYDEDYDGYDEEEVDLADYKTVHVPAPAAQARARYEPEPDFETWDDEFQEYQYEGSHSGWWSDEE